MSDTASHAGSPLERHSAKLQASLAVLQELTHSISQPAFLHCAMSFPSLYLCCWNGPARHCERLPTSTIFHFWCAVNGLVAHFNCAPVIQMWAIHLTMSQQELPEVRFRHQRTGLVQWLATIDLSFLLEVSRLVMGTGYPWVFMGTRLFH